MTSVSKNVYIDKPSTYVNAAKEINNNDSKLKIGDIVKRSKYY